MSNVHELVAASIHDIKNRLWFLEQYLHELSTQEQRLQPSILELSKLSVQLSLALFVQRSETGELFPRYEEIWLEDWVEELKVCLPVTGISLSWSVQAKTAFFDQQMISIVVRELIFNALKYARTSIRVQMRFIGATFCLFIEDDGPGFAQPIHLSEKNLSTGLGLTLVKHILYMHQHNHEHGDLVICPSYDLGGAKLEIRLP